MTIALGTPTQDRLDEAVDALRGWQDDDAPLQLHPGDLGWFWRFGAAATAAAVRMWSREGRILAVGLLDGPDVLRLTLAPDVRRDSAVAQQVVADVTDPQRGVLPAGQAAVEVPTGALVAEVLGGHGWTAGEAWTPLRRDLTEPVGTGPLDHAGLRFEVVGAEQAQVRAELQRASFDRSTFTDDHWHAMANGAPYADARCLVAYDDRSTAVAMVTVWSAGAGRPGLLEPLGVHRDHRGRGYGTAIGVAAAAALRELGSSSAEVCTPSSNVGAVATYRAAGFRELPQRLDRSRDG